MKKLIGAHKFKEHPDGLSLTIIKIFRLFDKRLKKEEKQQLISILLKYSNHSKENTFDELQRLKEIENKFNNLKNLLK